jgi:hypothetical protein
MIIHQSQGQGFNGILAMLHGRPATAAGSTEVAFAGGSSTADPWLVDRARCRDLLMMAILRPAFELGMVPNSVVQQGSK